MGKCKKKLRNQVMCSGIVDFLWFVGGCASVTHLCSFKFFYEICCTFTRIDRVESQITEKLTDLLATAKTGDEKFRVFSKFNALFFRHRIRGAIQQHQAELISTVKEDIQELQNMFISS